MVARDMRESEMLSRELTQTRPVLILLCISRLTRRGEHGENQVTVLSLNNEDEPFWGAAATACLFSSSVVPRMHVRPSEAIVMRVCCESSRENNGNLDAGTLAG